VALNAQRASAGPPPAQRALVGAALVALVLAVFAPALGFAWLDYDDDVYLTANPQLRLGLSPAGVAWAFTTFHGANWFPLTWLSWLLDYELFGLSAPAFRATNLLLHAAATLLLFLALVRFTSALGPSAFAAAVFGIHPLHVEPVVWAATRKDPLSAVFFAAVLLAWAGCERPRPGSAEARPPGLRRLAAVCALFLLGLLAKQTLVTLPCVLLLLDYWPLGRLSRPGDPARLDAAALGRALREKAPLFALAAGASVMTVAAQRSAGAVADLAQLPLALRLENAAVAAAGYVAQAFWPSGLAVFYPHPGAALSAGRLAASLALLAALSALALHLRRRVPAVLVGWLWFLGMLVPVSGLVQVGSQAMADRYTYLPLVGLAIAVAWGVPAALAAVWPDARRRGQLLRAAGCAALAALAVASSLQLRHWRDGESLMRRALAVTRDNHIAHAYLGIALLRRGEVEAAIAQWKESARLAPGYLTVLNNLAWLLATHPDARRRDPAAALAYAERAQHLAPDDPAVLDTAAAAYAAAGRFGDARRVAQRARDLARRGGDAALAEAIAARLAHYEGGRAWLEGSGP
jgi:tetratricopeptide (TPR) repeat protein